MPLENLAASARGRHDASGPEHSEERRGLRTYKWMQFEGKEHITEFDDSHFEMEGSFESHSSAGHKEYQARLRAISLRKQGKGKTEIAKVLARSERYVNKWWQKEESEVPKPWGVHGFLGGEMGFEANQHGATMGEDTATDSATWWRDVEIRRGFVRDPAIYTEIMENAAWEGLPSNTKDFKTGAAVMKYTKEGGVCIQSYQKAKYSPGLSPACDKALQKLFAEFGIEGRTVGVLLNRYDDGQAMLGSHRHDCWTALFSFGSERILTIDHTPLLCQDGDLVIFGTQRHGVPKMPEISTGRVTVVAFFYPNQLQKQKMWNTVTDEDSNDPSRTLVALQHDTYLGASAQEWALWGLGSKGYQALAQLKRVGLTPNDIDVAQAKEELIRHRFDTELVAAILARDSSLSRKTLEDQSRLVDEPRTRGRWGQRVELDSIVKQDSLKGDSLSNEDLEFCVRVLNSVAKGFEVPMSQEQLLPTGEKPVFQADDWDGISGDFVARFLRGGNVSLENLEQMLRLDQMTPAELISFGIGSLSERSFFEMLHEQKVRVLYDLRASESNRDMRANADGPFSVKSLRVSCKIRGLLYKHIAIGRESAYGILAHLQSAEGQHTLLELVWQAQRSCTAFFGAESDWRLDARLAIAEELTKAGHSVNHLQPDGELHAHRKGQPLPDWLLKEEDRLRKTEKMRHAGELVRKQKSSVDRSTESVAMKLMQKPVEVDTMEMLRDATNQQELKFAQRHLATMQRFSDKYELPSKVLAGTPKWITQEARDQSAYVEERKKEKATQGQSGNGGSELCCHVDDQETCDFQVECLICNIFYSWSDLADGDGCCRTCSNTCITDLQRNAALDLSKCLDQDEQDAVDVSPADDIIVQCVGCDISAPWSMLSLGDGSCPVCVGKRLGEDSGASSHSVGEVIVAHPGASSSTARWHRHISRAPDDHVAESEMQVPRS